VTWGKVGDDLDDDPRFLGLDPHAAGVFFLCLPYCLRHGDPHIPRTLMIARGGTDDDATALCGRAIWVEDGESIAIAAPLWADIECPPERRSSGQHAAAGRASAEARRIRYGTAQPRTAFEAVPRTSPNGVHEHPPNAPNPDSRIPVNSESPLRSTQSTQIAARTVQIHPNGSNGTLVGAYVDACTLLGITPNRKLLPRVGMEAKRLQQEGHDESVLIEAIGELARRNESPSQLAYIVGDVERARAGVDTSRHRAPPVNPIDAQIAAIRQRSQQTVIEVPKQ